MSLVIFAYRASCGTEFRGLKVSMKTTKTGVQRIKMNSQVMYGKEHEHTCHYLQIIHHHQIQPKQNHRRWESIKTETL